MLPLVVPLTTTFAPINGPDASETVTFTVFLAWSVISTSSTDGKEGISLLAKALVVKQKSKPQVAPAIRDIDLFPLIREK